MQDIPDKSAQSYDWDYRFCFLYHLSQNNLAMQNSKTAQCIPNFKKSKDRAKQFFFYSFLSHWGQIHSFVQVLIAVLNIKKKKKRTGRFVPSGSH